MPPASPGRALPQVDFTILWFHLRESRAMRQLATIRSLHVANPTLWDVIWWAADFARPFSGKCSALDIYRVTECTWAALADWPRSIHGS